MNCATVIPSCLIQLPDPGHPRPSAQHVLRGATGCPTPAARPLAHTMCSWLRGATRAIRLLLLLVLALAGVEFLFGSILDATPLRTYLYTPLNTTQLTLRSNNKNLATAVPLRPKSTFAKLLNPETKDSQAKNDTINMPKLNITKYNYTEDKIYNATMKFNVTANLTVQDNTPAYDGTPMFITKIMEKIKNFVTTEKGVDKEPAMPLCDIIPPDLGPILVNKTAMSLESVELKYPEVHWGGRYSPPNCTARHKVAIIVPFRDRMEHLSIFLNHMHPFLMKQQLEYGIFIVEQEGNKEFNRAKLMNVGFVESQRLKAGGWQCFIFHDIDLLPLDTRNMYSCPRQPRHMSASIDKYNFMLPYKDIFGGVSALTLEQFTAVNGFSNKYWGWGGEDDDMAYRLQKMNYHLARYRMSIARYAMLDHKKSVPNPKRYQLLSQTSKTFKKDGLTTLDYELAQVEQYHLYTHILANIDEQS